MERGSISEALIIAFGMVSWPILGKYSGAAGPWAGLIVMSGTAAVLALVAGLQGQLNPATVPTLRAVALLAAGAGLNGGAMYLYARRAALEPQTGKFVVLVAILVVLEAPAFDLLLNRHGLTARQWLGVACGIACVYFLTPQQH